MFEARDGAVSGDARQVSVGGSQRALCVLLVDDDEADRMLLRRAIVRSGLVTTVEEAGSAGEALARVGVEPAVDCVLIDLHLPDGSPEPVLRAVRRHFAVIVVTGLDALGLAAADVPAGADDFLSKDDASAAALVVRIPAAIARRQSLLEEDKEPRT